MSSMCFLIISIAYLLSLFALSKLLSLKNAELGRKIIHILWGNWWPFAFLVHKDYWIILAIPILIFMINILIFLNIGKLKFSSDVKNSRAAKDYGIILYPISFIFLIWLSRSIWHSSFAGGVGIMAMCYGDGFASLIGKRMNSYKFQIFNCQKSLAGSLGMLFITFASVSIYLLVMQYSKNTDYFYFKLVLICIISTFVEAITPSQFDNLTVPIITAIAFQKIL